MAAFHPCWPSLKTPQPRVYPQPNTDTAMYAEFIWRRWFGSTKSLRAIRFSLPFSLCYKCTWSAPHSTSTHTHTQRLVSTHTPIGERPYACTYSHIQAPITKREHDVGKCNFCLHWMRVSLKYTAIFFIRSIIDSSMFWNSIRQLVMCSLVFLALKV